VKSATLPFLLTARKSPLAAIFRRGPTNHVLLIQGNLDQDTFTPGQGFKGRIHERRCDLSPEGDMPLYFAATYKKPLQSWFAGPYASKSKRNNAVLTVNGHFPSNRQRPPPHA
jgi:hypothetical protein